MKLEITSMISDQTSTFHSRLFSFALQYNVACMLGNFGLHVFCCVSPKMPRITLNYIVMRMKELTVKRAITRHEVQLPYLFDPYLLPSILDFGVLFQ